MLLSLLCDVFFSISRIKSDISNQIQQNKKYLDTVYFRPNTSYLPTYNKLFVIHHPISIYRKVSKILS